MLLTVEKLKPTAKSLVLTCGGKEYFAKKDSGITAGITIEAETTTSDYNGKTYTWIGKYKQVSNGGNNHGAQQSSSSSSGSGVAAPVWANFVSNQVAHAIAAGRIDDPAQIKIWAAAAKQAFVELL